MSDNVPLAVEQRAVSAPPATTSTAPPASGDELAVAQATVRRERDAWASSLGRWDLFYAVLFAGTLLIVEASTMSTTARVIAAVALAAMVPWYLLIGRRLILASGPQPEIRGTIYLAGIVVLFAVADSQQPNVWFIAFALCPQCYQLASPRRAIVPAAAMNLIGGASIGYANQSRGGIESAAGLAICGIAFLLVYSGYITRIITQSDERANLIAQLDATRAELSQVSREAGVMAERQRLATEIHDTLAQGFSSILMLIQAADAQLGPEAGTARRQLDLAAQTARENLAEARSLVTGLAPAHLEASTLADALRRITERCGAESGIAASFGLAGDDRPLSAATEVVLLRAGQEALANVRKHAVAAAVTVRLAYACDRVRLEVTDDGTGFDPALVSGGYGLRGMRTRVDEAGGTVTVRSAPTRGTSVLVEVPVPEVAA
ncbi:MAG TPA: sensor histidine kinase [Streptosporangiaceae bacterium]|jgi:signal transduction histidine kinase